MQVELIPVDKEQPALPFTHAELDEIPFPGEEIELLGEDKMTIRVIKRVFLLTATNNQGVQLFIRVLPPQGVPT